MSDISLIISGNLTGFSRFYTSPNANEIYNEAKFDFDYRNYVTFLNNDRERAYAISFAPTVIAVSLVVRILDSFRRPGVLVISVLAHRGSKVCWPNASQSDNALHQLLNEVYDKFCEKNFVNGMLNQNAAVLMQDYYTDILAQFRLSHDASQRRINSRIDVEAVNKRVGYIASDETDAAAYLANVCRSSYEGFHHIILSPNAPQNIDESPIEVLQYRVLISNNNQTLPLVKLTDPIYPLSPKEGEKSLPQELFDRTTYKDVLDGKVEKILGHLNEDGDTIILTYRFDKEQKSITFAFLEGTKEIPFESVMPLVLVDRKGIAINLPSNPYVFEGDEIYNGVLTIRSDSGRYMICAGSENVDLRRFADGQKVSIQVTHATPFDISFPAPYDKPKSISFRNRNTGVVRKGGDFTDYYHTMLPGDLEDWQFTITSDYYETVKSDRMTYGQQMQIHLKHKVQKESTVSTNRSSGIKAETLPSQYGSRVIPTTGNISSGNQHGNNHSGLFSKMNIMRMAGVVVVLIAILALKPIIFPSDDTPSGSDAQGGEEVVVEYQSLKLAFIDASGDYIMNKKGTVDIFQNFIHIEIKPNGSGEFLLSEDTLFYQFSLDSPITQEQINDVSLESVELKSLTDDTILLKINNGTIDNFVYYDDKAVITCLIKINVNESLLRLYNELYGLTIINANDANKFISRISKDTQSDTAVTLDLMKYVDAHKDKTKPQEPTPVAPKQENGDRGGAVKETTSNLDLDGTSVTIDQLNSAKKNNNQYYKKNQDRIDAIISTIKNLQQGIKPTTTGLSKAQAEAINVNYNGRGPNSTNLSPNYFQSFKTTFRNIQSIDQFKTEVNKLEKKIGGF